MSRPDQSWVRRWRRLTLVAVLLLISAGCASEPVDERPLDVLTTPLPLRADARSLFAVPETLTYDVSFGIFPVGTLVYNVAPLDLGGSPGLRFEGITRPSALIAGFLDIAGTTRSTVLAQTLLPESYVWITANRDDPVMRAASFDRTTGEAFAAKWARAWTMTALFRAERLFDPVSAMFVLRALDVPEPPDELRYLLVEGVDLHLVTLRRDGTEVFAEGSADELRTERFRFRTDRLDRDGHLTDAKAVNNLFVWVASTGRRAIVRLEGRVAMGTVSVTLRR